MAFHKLKKQAFIANQNFFHQVALHKLKQLPFPQPKHNSFKQAFSYFSQKLPIFAANTINSHPAITYCPPKNTAILLSFALNPHAVTPEPRSDSKPFRRFFCEKPVSTRAAGKLLQNYFRQSFESSPESRGSQTSGVLLVLFVQAKRINPFLAGKLRSSSNLDSARRNGGFARTKLNPFAASRQCPCRDGTLRVLFGYFLHDAKSDNSSSLAGRFEVCRTSNQRTKTTTSYKPT